MNSKQNSFGTCPRCGRRSYTSTAQFIKAPVQLTDGRTYFVSQMMIGCALRCDKEGIST